jgi:hypothetical protein
MYPNTVLLTNPGILITGVIAEISNGRIYNIDNTPGYMNRNITEVSMYKGAMMYANEKQDATSIPIKRFVPFDTISNTTVKLLIALQSKYNSLKREISILDK